MVDRRLPAQHPLHIVAAGRSVTPGRGCLCIVCGVSPYDIGRSATELLGPNFTDHELLRSPDALHACSGCCAVLGGKPSKIDPPIRMLQVVALPGEPLRIIARADFEALLRSPIVGPHVLIWNDSMKRHASLRAGISTADELRIGGDDGQVRYRPDEHLPLLDAVKELRGGFARREIAVGEYPPKKIEAFGIARTERLDRIVQHHRPSYLLDFLIGTIAAPEPTPTEEGDMISDIDMRAAELVRVLTRNARVSVQWGVYHSGFARKRLVAACSTDRPLADIIERYARALDTSPRGLDDAVALVEAMTTEEEREILAAFRARPAIIVTVAARRVEE